MTSVITRRAFVGTLAGGFLAAPLAAEAQQAGKGRRIGVLLPGNEARAGRDPRMQAFYQALREFGWVEGQNVVFERRYAEGRYERLPALATGLAGLNLDVIVTASTPPAKAAKSTTTAIPIVILDPGDPVGTGLVMSLARPGGNVTGVASVAPDLAARRLQLLKEAASKLSHAAVLFNAAIPPAELALRELRAAGQTLGVRVSEVGVEGPIGFENAFATITKEGVNALVVFSDPLTHMNQDRIISFAATRRLPAMFGDRAFADVGGLISYGPNYPEMFRRGAYYVDRILRGTRPADLPVEQPTKFELVINLKTAKALGLTIPPSLLLRADELIQ